MHPLPTGFADLFDALRREVQRRISTGEWTERSLARHAGVSQPHLHQVLKGQKQLSVAMADRLRTALGIRLADLMGPGLDGA